MVMSRDEFIALLAPQQIAVLAKAIRSGLAIYADPGNYSPTALRDHSKSIRAQVRSGHIISEARRLIASDMSLGIVERTINDRILFVVNSQAYVSFKRLDQRLRGRNYQTRQARNYNRQLWPRSPGDADSVEGDMSADAQGGPLLRPSLWKPGALPGMINIWAGYQPDATETQFALYLVCPDGDENAWEWPLLDNDVAELVVASRPSETDAAKKIRRRVTLRPGAEKKQATDGTLE